MSKLTEKQKRRLARHHAHREWLSQRFDMIRAGFKPHYVKVSIWDTEWWQARRARISDAKAKRELVAMNNTIVAAKHTTDTKRPAAAKKPAAAKRQIMQRRAGSK